MKNLFFKVSTAILLLGTVGCQEKLDTVSGEHSTAVYMTKDNQLINISNAVESGETFIEVRLSRLAENSVNISVSAIDFFSEYNKKNGTEYKALPSSEYELYEIGNPNNKSNNGTLSISVKGGDYSSRIGVKVKPLDDSVYPVSTRYAIPLRISSSSAKILSNKDAIISFNRPYKTSVAEIVKGHNFAVELDPEIESTDEFTVQGQFMFLNWNSMQHSWNQSMINFKGGPGSNWWYTRVNPDHFQVKDLDADGEATHVKLDVKLNVWYQVSYVYKANSLKVYVNGELKKTFSRPGLRISKGEGATITVANSTLADSRDFRIREVRLWNRALSEAEIKDKLYLPVNSDSEGLLVYLPIDKKNGFKDLSKHKNIVKFGRHGKNVDVEKMEVKWTENVKFPAEGLVIEP